MRSESEGKHKKLQEELRLARAEYLRLVDELRHFNQPVLDCTHGMQAPDGGLAVATLGNERRLAFRKYCSALDGVSDKVTSPPFTTKEVSPVGAALTPRELEVLALIALGLSTKSVANSLGIAFKTAACHRYRIGEKLSAHNTADLTRAAIRGGLIQP